MKKYDSLIQKFLKSLDLLTYRMTIPPLAMDVFDNINLSLWKDKSSILLLSLHGFQHRGKERILKEYFAR